MKYTVEVDEKAISLMKFCGVKFEWADTIENAYFKKKIERGIDWKDDEDLLNRRTSEFMGKYYYDLNKWIDSIVNDFKNEVIMRGDIW